MGSVFSNQGERASAAVLPRLNHACSERSRYIDVGAFDDPVCNLPDCDHFLYEVNATSPEHSTLARDIAAASAVLLKNEPHPSLGCAWPANPPAPAARHLQCNRTWQTLRNRLPVVASSWVPSEYHGHHGG